MTTWYEELMWEIDEEDIPSTLGQMLRMLRKERGLTLERLATKSGVSHNTIMYYEKDTVEPSVFKLQAIATVLGVSIDWLLNRSYSPRTPS